MKKFTCASLVVALLTGTVAIQAADMPQMPEPAKEHQWLQQLVGDWEFEGKMTPVPDQPAIEGKGTESVRSLGGFWVLSEMNGSFMDMPITGIMTLGYDPETKKFIGTWVDSMSTHLWKYEGSLDPSGKTLTLESEGPCPFAPGKLSKFKEMIELKGGNERTFTSTMLGDDGKWTTMGTMNYRRKQ